MLWCNPPLCAHVPLLPQKPPHQAVCGAAEYVCRAAGDFCRIKGKLSIHEVQGEVEQVLSREGEVCTPGPLCSNGCRNGV